MSHFEWCMMKGQELGSPSFKHFLRLSNKATKKKILDDEKLILKTRMFIPYRY